MKSLKLLFLSTPVGPIGSGLGGGLEFRLRHVAQEMRRRGHSLKIVAPKKSVLGDIPIVEIAGEWQIHAQSQGRSTSITMSGNSVLAKMWEYARQVQGDYDLIFNIAYDWLPFYLTPFFKCPIAHFISMSSLNDAMDLIMEQVAIQFPGTIGVSTQTQANTFPFAKRCRCLGSAIDLSLYEFCSQPENALTWLGRISPEKGLEDAVAAAKIADMRLLIFGLKQDENYWDEICREYPDALIEYGGFLPTEKLQAELGKSRSLLVTPRWEEAYPRVALEALACGVPLIAYDRGGLSEIVREGKTGFLVEPDSVDGLVEAIGRIDEIDRYACRQQAETEYSLQEFGDRFEEWFGDILQNRRIVN